MDKLIDIYGNEYIVQDITTFKEHILGIILIMESLMVVYMKKMVFTLGSMINSLKDLKSFN